MADEIVCYVRIGTFEGIKKFEATPTKQDLRTTSFPLLGAEKGPRNEAVLVPLLIDVLLKISDVSTIVEKKTWFCGKIFKIFYH